MHGKMWAATAVQRQQLVSQTPRPPRRSGYASRASSVAAVPANRLLYRTQNHPFEDASYSTVLQANSMDRSIQRHQEVKF